MWKQKEHSLMGQLQEVLWSQCQSGLKEQKQWKDSLAYRLNTKQWKKWKLSHKEEALSIQKDPKTTQVAHFSATNGWFGGFKHWCNFQSFQQLGEDMSTDENAAKELPSVKQMLIEGESYALYQNLQFWLNTYIIKACLKVLYFKERKA